MTKGSEEVKDKTVEQEMIEILNSLTPQEHAEMIRDHPYTLQHNPEVDLPRGTALGGPLNRKMAFELSELMSPEEANDFLRFARLVVSFKGQGNG